MITLPLYVIEKMGNVWQLYNTQTCVCLEFETRMEAENKLASLK